MSHYCLCPVEGDPPARLWVLADSEKHARRLISLNISEAADATDAGKYECETDATFQPPFGWIYKTGGQSVAITKR